MTTPIDAMAISRQALDARAHLRSITDPDVYAERVAAIRSMILAQQEKGGGSVAEAGIEVASSETEWVFATIADMILEDVE